jgi:hypothetical protein
MLLRSACVLAAVCCTFGSLSADEIATTAAIIDRHIFERLSAEQVTPADQSSDAEFLRRVWLDVAGKIPPAAEVRRFLADTRTDKRSRLIEQLLSSSNYASHFATFWRDILLPELKSDEQVQQLLPGFEAWLRQHLKHDTAYDQLVREIVTTRLAISGRDVRAAASGDERSAIAFYQAKEIAPENLAAATSRIFLGIRLECAQCHDHPFDDWKQQQFWSFAAFFGGLVRQGDEGVLGRVSEVFDRRELVVPDTETVVQAGFLDGSDPRWRRGVTSRQILAEWITSPDNPYFARMAVNRIWGKFFGIGLVDPVDDFGESNPCSHPQLLDSLAREFVAHNFDVKFLIRAITVSRTYQLSSAATGDASPRLFASMPIKGLTPEQLLDSLMEAGGYSPQSPSPANQTGAGSPRAEILELFANDTDPPTGQQTSILQALALMNGALIESVVDLQQSPRLSGVANASQGTQEQIETLFLATLSRRPTESESHRMMEFVDSNSSGNDDRRAFAHMFWALLNSAEFATNH